MTDDEDEGFPWQIKAMFVLIALVLLFIVVIDLLEFASAF
jgi:hypothetical protein